MPDPHAGGDLAATVLSKATAATAGLAGAYIRQLFPPRKPVRQRIAEYIGGAFTAVYGGPVAGPLLYQAIEVVAKWWGTTVADVLARQSVESLAGFMCGAIGLTIIEGLFVLARRWRDDPRLPSKPGG